MFLFKILNYATHAKCRGTPGDYSDQARHQSQPSATSATPATQMECRRHQVPRLPRKWNVDVTKCHACTQSAAAPRATNGDQARHQSQPTATSATPATPNAGRCR